MEQYLGIGNKTRLPTITISIQYHTKNPRLCIMASKIKNERETELVLLTGVMIIHVGKNLNVETND